MKLKASRGRRDATDIDKLLAICRVVQQEQAEDLFETYYPREAIPERGMARLRRHFDDGPPERTVT